MALIALIAGALVAYWAGRRAQRYHQARADVRDNRVKLRKARAARAAERRAATAGWIVLAAVAALAGLVVLAATAS